MKKLNYLQVHKNKSGKKLKNRRPSRFQIQSAMISMMSFQQHAMIVSQSFVSIAEKQLAVLDNVKSHSDAVMQLFRKEKANRYLKTN